MKKLSMALLLIAFLVVGFCSAIAAERAGEQNGRGPKPDSGDCIPDGPW
jgi:hypothetical protein